MTQPHILIVEDIASLSLAYAGHLESAGFACTIASSLAEASAQLSAPDLHFDAVLLDLQLPDGDGLDWLTKNAHFLNRYAFVVATADSSLNRAIEAMRLGAYDFMVKPLAPKRLIASIRSAHEHGRQSARENASDAADIADSGFAGFIGDSPQMRTIYDQIRNVAKSKATVFVTGESGTGKEVCAEALHEVSGRKQKPFVAINCGAIPEDLLESELFGHLKGSFTGAISDRVGAVQAAQGGTLFLDEVCEMELKLQVKLLRFLQTGSVQRVGATQAEEVDVRIVCATNRDPKQEVAAGRFREDLYYRLAVVPMHLPALHERGQDIIVLANNFLQRFGDEEGKIFHPLDVELHSTLLRHRWPGNVRELQNLMRRAAVMFPGPDLDQSIIAEFSAAPFSGDLAGNGARPAPASPQDANFAGQAPNYVQQAQAHIADSFAASPTAAEPQTRADFSVFEGQSLEMIEKMIIEHFIRQNAGSVPKAAKKLGVSPSTIYRKQDRWAQNVA